MTLPRHLRVLLVGVEDHVQLVSSTYAWLSFSVLGHSPGVLTYDRTKNGGQVTDAPELKVLDSFELYTPASQNSAITGVLQTPRVGHTATLLNNGQVLIIGGTDNSSNPLATVEL